MTTPAPTSARRGTGAAVTGGVLLLVWMIIAGCVSAGFLALVAFAFSQLPAGASLAPLRTTLIWAAAVVVFAVIGSVLSGLFVKRVGRGEGLPTLIATTVAGGMLIVSSLLLIRQILLRASSYDLDAVFPTWIGVVAVAWAVPLLVAWAGLLHVLRDPARRAVRPAR